MKDMIDVTEPMAVSLASSRGGAGRLLVLRRGEAVLDKAFGVERDDLFWLFSVSKPFVAMLVHLLVTRGALRLDDPVATHWPAYAVRDKTHITVRQVLAHRSGVPFNPRAAGRGPRENVCPLWMKLKGR
jgi:CubicO group peptidase (beta-lactamase class C family)